MELIARRFTVNHTINRVATSQERYALLDRNLEEILRFFTTLDEMWIHCRTPRISRNSGLLRANWYRRRQSGCVNQRSWGQFWRHTQYNRH